MTKITLRAYNREIEVITDQGKIDFAIAHCLHILKFFPKHVDTYRLLGKAYLENQRLGDAADVLQRVLSAVPDDFVSHIGMSIIREDEGNLDAAIWHMQRAYDVQSSNITIQDELRRLYDRRDGVEPPKIRLTRAALARMYARGDLVSEAIAELRAALQEEPDRVDLLVLLSRMYATNQQRVKSIQTCSQVLNKLPYCLEANLIIARSLEETNRFDEAQPYLERARELDPYAAFLSEQAPTVEAVPDAAVSLLKLDESELRSYAAAAATQPAWVTTLGAEMPDKAEQEDNIDWLLEQPAIPPESLPDIGEFVGDQELAADLAASAAFGTGGIEAAGRHEAEGMYDDAGREEETPARNRGIDTADLDLGSLMGDEESPELPDWMAEAGWGTSAESETGPAEIGETGPASFDDWAPAEPEQNEDPDDSGLYRAHIPDWLQALAPADLGEGEAVSAASEVRPPETPPGETWDDFTDSDDEAPDWLKDMDRLQAAAQQAEPEPEPAEAIPDWLAAIAPEETGVTAWLETNADPETGQLETEEWQGMEKPNDVPMEEPEMSGEFAEMGDDEAMRWLESLAAKQGVGEEELLSDPEDRPDAPPDWVMALGAADSDEEGLALETRETMMETPPAEKSSDWEEIEAAVAGMGGQPAASAPDEMDWLGRLGEEEEAEIPGYISQPEEPVQETPAWSMEDTAAIDADDLPDWLKDQIGAGEPGEASSEVPTWLQEIAGEETRKEEEGMAEPGGGMAGSASDVPDWLQDLAAGEREPAQPGVPEWLQQTMITSSPFDRIETPGERPQETMAEAPAAEEPTSSFEAEAAADAESVRDEGGVPDWLREMVRAEEAQGRGGSDEGIPDWLQQTMLAPMPIPMPTDAEEEMFTEPAAEPEPAESVETPPEEVYAWEQEMLEFTGEAAAEEAAGAGGEGTVFEDMFAEPPAEPAAGPIDEVAEVQPAEDWWMQDTGSFDRPALPIEEPVEEIGIEAFMETADEPADQPIADPMADSAPETIFEPVMPEPADEFMDEPVLESMQPEPMLAEMPAMAPPALDEARGALSAGDVDGALAGYRSLIRAKTGVAAVIEDLQRALEYDHPVNIEIWATLGDAYAVNDNLQHALDAYTKAEELLR